MDLINLTRLVSEFRAALKDLAESGYWFNITISNEFPEGSCDDSSMLLAAYLADNGYPGALRISGTKGGNRRELESHVWLRLDGQIIDITGSQFENYSQPEILISEKDALLSTFRLEENPKIADFRQVPEVSGYNFNRVYDDILKRIAASALSD